MEQDLPPDALPTDFAQRLERLLAAVRAGDEGETRTLLEAEPRLALHASQSNGFTALHIASGSGDTALVKLLLRYGANPNALDKGDNASPLHHAAERNRLDVAKLLVAAGADVNWDRDLHQRGPLGWAVVFNPHSVEVAEYLLSQGAKLDIFSAIALDRADAIREMFAAEPHVLRQRMSRFELFGSPIEFATSRRKFEIAHLLIELGSDPSLSDLAGLDGLDLLERRLAEGPHPGTVNLALKSAVMAGQTTAARRLLAHGADPNFAPQTTSLLFDAIGDNDEPMARLLIEFGADLEFKDTHHRSTPLSWQVFFGRPEPTRLALALGAARSSNLVGLAESGARGDLRLWSATPPEPYREVAQILREAAGAP